MLNSLRAAARFIQDKIGWNRIGVLLSIAIIAVAWWCCSICCARSTSTRSMPRCARPTATHRGRRGFRRRRLFHAHLLRLVRAAHDRPHRIPYRVAALAGFTSYSVGHNIGATVFTGGAVRYRIYSAYGLDASKWRKSVSSPD